MRQAPNSLQRENTWTVGTSWLAAVGHYAPRSVVSRSPSCSTAKWLCRWCLFRSTQFPPLIVWPTSVANKYLLINYLQRQHETWASKAGVFFKWNHVDFMGSSSLVPLLISSWWVDATRAIPLNSSAVVHNGVTSEKMGVPRRNAKVFAFNPQMQTGGLHPLDNIFGNNGPRDWKG